MVFPETKKARGENALSVKATVNIGFFETEKKRKLAKDQVIHCRLWNFPEYLAYFRPQESTCSHHILAMVPCCAVRRSFCSFSPQFIKFVVP